MAINWLQKRGDHVIQSDSFANSLGGSAARLRVAYKGKSHRHPRVLKKTEIFVSQCSTLFCTKPLAPNQSRLIRIGITGAHG